MPRPTTLPEPWRTLAVRLGGVQALADALHSSPRTIRQWAHAQRRPQGPAQAAIAALFAAQGIPAPSWPTR